MFKTIKYISALTVAGISLAACSDGIITNSEDNTISGTGEKTPLEIAVTLQDTDSGAKTRAVNGSFETGDQLIAYVQQVEASEATINANTTISEKISQLVTWKLSEKAIEEATTADNKMTVTSDNKDGELGMTLYWDDFSNSTDDIRGEKRFLRVGYGYCYNGGTPSPALTENTGILGWSVQADQTNASNEKKSDLLWASAKVPFNADNYVKYEHVVNSRKPLPVTYTHAMSKVTIELVLDEGFKKDDNGKAVAFGNNSTTPTLFANKTATEVDAINQNIKTTEVSGDAAKITMRLTDDEATNKMHRVYEAIIAPTVMKAGNVLAEVTVDGNKYELKLTDEMLKTEYPASSSNATWSSKLSSYDNTTNSGTVVKTTEDYNANNGGITQSGINYRLVATLKKQRIEVQAMILPWNDVYASTTGTISFNADVVTSDVLDATAVTDGSFDLWRSTANSAEADYDNNASSADVIDMASTYTYTGGKWVGDPAIYWENGTTKHYFRALAKANYDTDSNGKTTLTNIESVGGSTAVAQTYTNNEATSVDLLWAQTSEHTATDANGHELKDNDGNPKVYEAGGAIDPRSGNVPLSFQHAMSKISITLGTTEGADKVTGLKGATVSIINLYDRGTISVKDGTVSNLTTSNADPMTIKDIPVAQMQDFLVVPQSLVKLKDGSARNLTPTFYSSEELTGIYSNRTSHEPSTSEAPTYYLTSQLVRVDAELYSEAEILTHNANLKDADDNVISVSTESVKIQAEYYNDIQIYNDNKIFKKTDVLTKSMFETLLSDDASRSIEDKVWVKEYIYYDNTLQDLKDFVTNLDDTSFSNLPDDFKRKNENDSYTLSEFKTYVTGLDTHSSDEMLTRWLQLDNNKYKKKSAVLYTYEDLQHLEEITSAMWEVLPPEAKIKTREEKYTAEEAIAYNSKLPGAWHEGEVKTPAYYKLPTGTTLTSYEPGSLKNAGNKIMLYVYLADGTRYSADLSTCLVANDEYVSEPNAATVTSWEGNHHYKYKITLTKAKIELRALIKDWVEYKVSGDATLDWD